MYEGAKLITSSRTQGLRSGLCDFAQVVPFLCPFEVGLWLCCVRFSSGISPRVSWLCVKCGVAHLSWSIQNVSGCKPTCGSGRTAPWTTTSTTVSTVNFDQIHATLLSIVYLVLASEACLRLDQIQSPHLVSDWIKPQLTQKSTSIVLQ